MVWTTLAVLVFLTAHLAAQSADEDYLKAMQISDNCQKIQALDAYITKYAGQGTANEHWAYAYYCLTPCASKNAQKAADYGEKALAMSGIDEQTRVGLMATVPVFYDSAGLPDKAKAAATRLIEYGKASGNANLGRQLQAGGYELLGRFAEKAGDYGAAAENYITGYGIFNAPSIAKQLNNLASTLYKGQKYAEAEKVFRQFYAADKGPESAALLGQTLYKAGKIDEALAIYKEAYARKKTASLALNIAIILNKEVDSKPALKAQTIDALVEAGLLNPAQQKPFHQRAFNLYVSNSPDLAGINAKIEEHNKAIEELTKTYNDKFGNKSEDDLTDGEKNTMKKLNDAIEVEKQAIAQLQASQKGILDKFNQLVAQVRTKLGK
jgi:tetratricopeptide (TPR) repeat protein